MKLKFPLFLFGAALACGLDQLAKHFALLWTARIPRGMAIQIIPDILEINYAQNVGAAFSKIGRAHV